MSHPGPFDTGALPLVVVATPRRLRRRLPLCKGANSAVDSFAYCPLGKGIDILDKSCGPGRGNCEIGRFLHLKSEIRSLKLNNNLVQPQVSDFGFEVQESFNFTISSVISSWITQVC